MSWTDWAGGVLGGIGAPVNSTNLDTLWAWSNKESGADVMRWNNPLNTTEGWPGAVSMNSVGVKSYLNVNDGILATVATLDNGYYPVILAKLRGSVPRAQWDSACANLGTWGTGCNWLQATYGPAPGNLTGDDFMGLIDNPTPEQSATFARLLAEWDNLYQNAFIYKADLAAAVATLKATQGGSVTVDNTAVLAAIADLKAHPAVISDPALFAAIQTIAAHFTGK